MKVVFLDFDGVLNSREYFAYIEANGFERFADMRHHLDPFAIQRLNRILAETGAKVVVSSTWRLGLTVQELQALLASRGFEGEVIDKTGDAPPRWLEIREWCEANLSYRSINSHGTLALNDAIVILDDDRVGHFGDREINTSFERGLLDEHVERAIAVLNR